MARMRRELCFSAGSFTYAGLYQMWGRELPWMWDRPPGLSFRYIERTCQDAFVTQRQARRPVPQPYRLLPVLAVWAMRVGSMAAPVANLPSGGATEVSTRRAMT